MQNLQKYNIAPKSNIHNGMHLNSKYQTKISLTTKFGKNLVKKVYSRTKSHIKKSQLRRKQPQNTKNGSDKTKTITRNTTPIQRCTATQSRNRHKFQTSEITSTKPEMDRIMKSIIKYDTPYYGQNIIETSIEETKKEYMEESTDPIYEYIIKNLLALLKNDMPLSIFK